jgi:hypothetical protein
MGHRAAVLPRKRTVGRESEVEKQHELASRVGNEVVLGAFRYPPDVDVRPDLEGTLIAKY